MRSFFKNYWALLIPVLVLLIALLFFFRKSGGSSAENTVIGMVDADFVDVAAGFPGRLDSLLIHQGDTVKKDQVLGVLHTTEINAVRNQALAAIEAAQSQLKLLQSGARPEAVQAADKLYQITQDQYELMQKTYARIEKLHRDQVVSGQEKDIVYFRYQAAEKEMETARLNMQMLKNGTRPELITAAAAILKQAEEAYTITKSLSDKTYIRAPADGIVSSLVIEEGEMASIGYPMMTIQKPASYFIRFNIRQDDMSKLALGTVVKMNIPGCVPETFDAKVAKVSPSLTFANWVPVQEKGKFELRTFTVECKPVNQSALQGLRPGMTAAMQMP